MGEGCCGVMGKNRIRMGLRLAAPALLALGLAGCFGGGSDDDVYDAPPPAAVAGALPAEHGTSHVESQPNQVALQCVPYAREHSLIKITGDAYTWWDKAAGKYERGPNPATGAVLVLFNYAGANRGHVAVVRRVVSTREIRIDHANWLDDGSIYVNDPVVDVSAANDWSQVKVWNIKTGGWGTKIFPVQGFIGSGSSTTPRGSDDDALPPVDDMVASAMPGGGDADAAPVQRMAVATPAKPKVRTVRTQPAKVPDPVIPVGLSAYDRDPAPDSGFALTDADKAIP
jgi:surface antigen